MMTKTHQAAASTRPRGNGDARVAEEMMPVIYDELHALAHHCMSLERAGHTLQPTALVHEAYMRLANSKQESWMNRAHFFAAAATAVRRILVEHARSRRSRRRHGHAPGVDPDHLCEEGPGEHILEVDEALHRLAEDNAQQAKLVEMRFFGGLKIEEIAEALGTSPRTVARDWVVARAWLARELREGIGSDE